jgi:hypothetical protein
MFISGSQGPGEPAKIAFKCPCRLLVSTTLRSCVNGALFIFCWLCHCEYIRTPSNSCAQWNGLCSRSYRRDDLGPQSLISRECPPLFGPVFPSKWIQCVYAAFLDLPYPLACSLDRAPPMTVVIVTHQFITTHHGEIHLFLLVHLLIQVARSPPLKPLVFSKACQVHGFLI